MVDKYYTPTIEEFHVGFEFELLEYTHEEPCGGWTHAVFGNLLLNPQGGQFSTDAKDVERWINDENVRVKYLDKEDIEELGFVKRTKDEWIGWRDYSLGAISGEIGYFLKATLHKPRMDDIYKIYLHRYLDDDTKIEPKVNEGESELVYKGKIKNKSELKFILTMVNIF